MKALRVYIGMCTHTEILISFLAILSWNFLNYFFKGMLSPSKLGWSRAQRESSVCASVVLGLEVSTAVPELEILI